MMRSLRGFSFLFVIAATALAAAEEKSKSEAPKFELTKDEQSLMELINQERAKEKLPALKPQSKLFQTARGHSANMAKQRKMEHVLDGKTPGQRVLAAGYDYGKISENIAISEGRVTLPMIVKSWMESKSHRANLLGDKVTETGLGLATNDKGETYYTQLFARPRKVIERSKE